MGGQEEGGRGGAIVFILMRAKEGAVTLGNYSLTTTHSPGRTDSGGMTKRAGENVVETRTFVPMILVLLWSNARGRRRMFTRARYFIPKWANTRSFDPLSLPLIAALDSHLTSF